MTTELALLDVNVLVALSWDSHAHHAAAHRGFAEVERWCTTPATESALVRLSLTPAVVGRAVAASDALAHLRAIRSVDGWSFLPDTASFATPTVDLRTMVGRNQVTDMQLVNIAATHDAVLTTFDSRIVEALAPGDRGLVEVWPV